MTAKACISGGAGWLKTRRPALKLSERADLKQSSLSTCLRLNYSEPSSLLVPSCRKARPSLHRCWRCL